MFFYDKFLFFLYITKCFYVVETRQFRVTDQVYMDIQDETKPLGRVVIGLFGDLAPKAVKNFKVLATKGIKGKSYKGTSFNRIIKRFMVQGGDVVSDDGSGSISIYGETFKDENLDTQHTMAGFVSMANRGKDTNGCQFIITTTGTPWLDNIHTVVGRVIEGQNIVHLLEHTPTDVDDRPLRRVYIADCGLLPTPQPFYISDDPYDLWAWIRASAVPLTMSFSILGFFHWMIRKMEI
ncbi:peptidyl-prolyl cis-trans isomerase, rhodopsin-specific isozyme-like isoform X1 [Leguminivora glycinivorella]|uniref:peptidyl-prolyl cis-trans isomerase, rhodopsin-specific isozyme-like isoform X1 n=2 Tax=Leguminivora glycinivorella TaxID=1035111 RepID=UPI00200CA55A|nr:peptidyl-prolyl cis-trans isomerase, rhodopsin-specific isozyme-like isoform X1 [Leguminivora glycinivorella]